MGALLLVPPAAASTPLKGGLDVAPDVGIDGDTQAATDSGLLHARVATVADASVELEASKIEVTTDWQETTRARTPTGQSYDADYDVGTDTYRFSDASMTLETFDRSPEVLAIGTDDAQVSAQSTGQVDLGMIENRNITQVGTSDEASAADQAPPGFWYHVGGPSLSFANLDQGTVTGDFTLFVHNVTMVVDSDGSEPWRNWTGERYENPSSPVSEYEIRVTVIEVTDGTLTLETPDALSMIGRQSDLTVDGTITADQAQGELIEGTTKYTFRDAPLRLEGSGSLSAMSPSVTGTVGGTAVAPNTEPIKLETAGQFDVEDNSDVSVSSVPAEQSASNDGLTMVAGAIALALVGLFLARGRLRPAIERVRAHVRERRVEQWMEAGDRLTSVRDYEKAHECYAKITDKYPEVAEAWYAKGVVLSELGRHDASANAFEEANEAIGGDDPELIDLSAREAWQAGDETRARPLFEELAVKDPMRLRERLNEPAFAELRDEPWIEALFEPDEEDLSSYA